MAIPVAVMALRPFLSPAPIPGHNERLVWSRNGKKEHWRDAEWRGNDSNASAWAGLIFPSDRPTSAIPPSRSSSATTPCGSSFGEVTAGVNYDCDIYPGEGGERRWIISHVAPIV